MTIEGVIAVGAMRKGSDDEGEPDSGGLRGGVGVGMAAEREGRRGGW